MPNLLVDISAHGAGHLAQTAPVLDLLVRRRDDVRLLLRTGIDRARLAARIAGPFELLAAPENFGLAMTSPFLVDGEATLARYRAIHADLDARIDSVADILRDRRIDLVVSNIGYVSLAAAARAGVPSLAFGSVNWRDVLEHYCRGVPGIDDILARIGAAYRGAGAFLRLAPGMPMPGLVTREVAAPIVAVGENRSNELRRRFSLPADAPIVVFGFDASAHTPPAALAREQRWRAGEILLLGPERWGLAPPWSSFEDAGVSFLDALASATLAVAKPGYGMVTEAAAAGVPLLLLGRRDWPETAAFLTWIDGRVPCRHLDVALEDLAWEDIAAAMAPAASRLPPAPLGNGEAVIAEAILELAGRARP